jgi:hypothetical protein
MQVAVDLYVVYFDAVIRSARPNTDPLEHNGTDDCAL